MPDSRPQVLPNLFIIGAAKSGTTSLHRYLDAHPEISMSEPKEPRIFADARWQEKLPDYAAMFSSPGAPVRGESSTRYTRFPVSQGIPKRVASACPDARLIYVVRDPVDRIVANWVQRYAALIEHRSLDNVLKDLDQPANFYVSASRYATQIEQWLECFERERILVIDQGDLRRDRTRTLLEVLRFLEVEEEVPPNLDTEFNVSNSKERMTPAAARLWFAVGAPAARRLPAPVGRYISDSRLFPVEKVGKPALSDQLRAELTAELRGEADRFRDLTEMKFASWSV
jgi:hypothetical protein